MNDCVNNTLVKSSWDHFPTCRQQCKYSMAVSWCVCVYVCVCDVSIEEIIQSSVCTAKTLWGHRVLGVCMQWVTCLNEGMRSISIHMCALSVVSWTAAFFLPSSCSPSFYPSFSFYSLNGIYNMHTYISWCATLSYKWLWRLFRMTLLNSISSPPDWAHMALLLLM